MVVWLREIAAENRVVTSLIGMGYIGMVIFLVVLCNIFENLVWYIVYILY